MSTLTNEQILSAMLSKTILFVELKASYDGTKLMYPFKVFDTLDECERFVNRRNSGEKIVDDFCVDIPFHLFKMFDIATPYGKSDQHISGQFIIMHHGEYLEDRKTWGIVKEPTGIEQFHEAHPDYREADVSFRELKRFERDGRKFSDWVSTSEDRRAK